MPRLVRALLAASLIGACSAPSDLDSPCRLMVPDAARDGGERILAAGDPSIDPSSDFIATGDSDCDELICIRRAHPAAGFYDDSDGDAHGRCSASCIADESGNRSSNCSSSSAPLLCEQLNLDTSTIDAFCNANPASCQSILGTATSASYCVDPFATQSTSG